MKKLLYILLLLPLLTQAQQVADAQNMRVGNDGLHYVKGQTMPFSGTMIVFYPNGRVEKEVSLQLGYEHGTTREYFRDKKQITYNNILFSTRIYSSILEESH